MTPAFTVSLALISILIGLLIRRRFCHAFVLAVLLSWQGFDLIFLIIPPSWDETITGVRNLPLTLGPDHWAVLAYVISCFSGLAAYHEFRENNGPLAALVDLFRP